MRKLLVFLILLFPVVLFSVSHVSAVSLSLINPNQYPLTSGSDFSLAVSVYNPSSSQANNVTVGIDPSYPFIAVSGETYQTLLGSLSGYATSYPSFRLRTADNVAEGSYPLRVYYCLDSCAVKTYKDINLQFSGISDVKLTGYSFSSQKIVPETPINVSLQINNFGTGKVSSASVAINNSLNGIVPFVFVGSPDNYYLGDVMSGDSYNITFTFKINKALPAGVYSVPINLNSGSTSSQIGVITLDLKNDANVTVPLVSSQPIMPKTGSSFTIIATLENSGPGEADSVVAYLMAGSKIIGSNYIGQISSGDDDSAIFDLSNTKYSNYTVKVVYTDDLGIHTLNVPYSVNFTDVTDFSWITNAAIVIIVLGALFYYYKKKNRKKK